MEYELKYAATPKDIPIEILTDPLLTASFAEAWRTIPMHTTYYDLPDHSLRSRHYTLRCRREGDASVVTLKTGTGIKNLRGEWETEAGSLAEGIPLLLHMGAPDIPVEASAYVPVCGAQFTRKAVLLRLRDCTAEFAYDIGRLYNGNRELEFSEIELELKSGTPEAMEALGNTLCEKYNLHEERKGKFTRAIAL